MQCWDENAKCTQILKKRTIFNKVQMTFTTRVSKMLTWRLKICREMIYPCSELLARGYLFQSTPLPLSNAGQEQSLFLARRKVWIPKRSAEFFSLKFFFNGYISEVFKHFLREERIFQHSHAEMKLNGMVLWMNSVGNALISVLTYYSVIRNLFNHNGSIFSRCIVYVLPYNVENIWDNILQ